MRLGEDLPGDLSLGQEAAIRAGYEPVPVPEEACQQVQTQVSGTGECVNCMK